MLIFIRCNDIESDSRLLKYVNYVKSKEIDYKILGWNRLNKMIERADCTFFDKKIGYNVGGIKAVKGRLLWMWFVVMQLFKQKSPELVIHACDLDAAFPACVFKIISRKKVTVIFDIFDWFSDTLHIQNIIIKFGFHFMEWFCIKQSDEIIICEPERKNQIPYKGKNEMLVLPNIPSFKENSFLIKEKKYEFNNNNITIAYVGGFYRERFLDELFTLAHDANFNLLIAGFGEEAYESKCAKLDFFENVKYFGKVDYKTGLNIMFNADLIYAMYCKSNPNHIYAAPNKFYESMFLGKPILSTKGIIVESKIQRYDIGYTIEENIQELISLIKVLNEKELQVKGQNAKNIWNKKYINYVENFFDDIYLNIIS